MRAMLQARIELDDLSYVVGPEPLSMSILSDDDSVCSTVKRGRGDLEAMKICTSAI